MRGDAMDDREAQVYGVEEAFGQARADEVPTFAPNSFKKAEDQLRALRKAWRALSSESLHDDIVAVRNALEVATETAKATAPHLASLIQIRTQSIRSATIAYRVPNQLNAAEALFREAVDIAEQGDFATADGRATEAAVRFHEATIASVERGALRQIENEVEFAHNVVSEGVSSEAHMALDRLRVLSRAARDGGVSPGDLREAIAGSAVLIRRLLDPRNDGSFGPGVLDPPAAPGGGWAPGTFDPPQAPLTMRISDRRADALTVRWKDSSSMFDAQRLERSVDEGPFEIVAELGPSVGGWTVYEDTGLSPDSFHQYRVRVQNEWGSNVTTHDNMACGYTRTAEDQPVWRIQVYVRVADISDAGSEDAVQVRLQSPLFNYAPNGNGIWLDHAPRLVDAAPLRWEDDFARASEFRYELSSDYVEQLCDITMLSFRKVGTDAVAIAELALWVNDQVVFRKEFGDTSSTCLWLDEGDGHEPRLTIYHPELRASADWQGFHNTIPPLFIANDELVRRFEAIVGDTMHGTPAYWQATLQPVRITKASIPGESFERIHVVLRLGGDVAYVPDPNITLGFDLKLRLECNTSNTEVTLSYESDNVDASVGLDPLIDLFLLGLAPVGIALLVLTKEFARRAVVSAWQTLADELVLQTAGRCPSLVVGEDTEGGATIEFQLA